MYFGGSLRNFEFSEFLLQNQSPHANGGKRRKRKMEFKTKDGIWAKWSEIDSLQKMTRIELIRKIWKQNEEQKQFREKIADIDFVIYITDRNHMTYAVKDYSGEWTFWDRCCYTPYQLDEYCSNTDQAMECFTYARVRNVKTALGSVHNQGFKTGAELLREIARLQESSEEGTLTFVEWKATHTEKWMKRPDEMEGIYASGEEWLSKCHDDDEIRCISAETCDELVNMKNKAEVALV